MPKSTITPPSQFPIPLAVPTNLSAASIMPFVAAGVAERDVKACITGLDCGSQWMAGVLVGGGIRSAIAANWSVKAEYDYIFFNKAFTPINATALFPGTFKTLNEQRVMFGIDYHL